MSASALWDWRNGEQRKTAAAFLTSLLFHLLIILLVALFFALRPAPTPPVLEEVPVELTLIDPPSAKPNTKPSYIETNETQRSDAPPENMVFESDKDTRAAAMQPAAGDAPVPTQDGMEIPALEFENKEYTPGKEARPSAPAVQAQPASTPAPPAEPASTPRQTTQLALLEPPKPANTPRPQTEQPKPAVQQQPPQAAKPPGYQPQTRITRIRGNISNRGRSAVDATATPLGRYKKMLSDAIGSRWYFYVNEQMGLLTMGTVDLRFIVTANGKAQKVQVVRNSSNESFAACSVRAVVEAEIPPIPAELVPMLENGRIEIDYSFTILSN